MNWITIVLSAIGAFIATNVDDIFLLTFFFAQVSPSLRKRHIVLGQYLGFGVLLAVSALGFLTALVIPPAWIGLLGLLPIGIGLKKLLERRSDTEEAQVALPPAVSGEQARPLWASVFAPQTYSVALVTMANGGDNLGIYIPLFASSSAGEVALILLVFMVLIGVWCYGAYHLGSHPTITRTLDRYGHLIVPFVLIGLGCFIMLDSGTLAALARWLATS